MSHEQETKVLVAIITYSVLVIPSCNSLFVPIYMDDQYTALKPIRRS